MKGYQEIVYTQFDLGRNFLVRAGNNSNLVQFVTELAEKKGITVATFTAIGALKCAKLGFYDQDRNIERSSLTLLTR